MSFRLTGIATLLKRHGRNLTLLRDADTVYDTNTSETYQTINGWNEFEVNLVESAYSNNFPGFENIGTITREFNNQHSCRLIFLQEGSGLLQLYLSGEISENDIPTFINVNNNRSVLISSAYIPEYDFSSFVYTYTGEYSDNLKITFEEPQWQVRGYFYDSKEVNIYDTQVGEGNRRVVFYPIDLSGNPLPKPRIGDKVRGQSDVVSIYRVEEVMSNDKVLVYLCRVNE